MLTKSHRPKLIWLSLLVASSLGTLPIYAADITNFDESYSKIDVADQANQNCLCDGIYLGLSVGYAQSDLGYLTKGLPVVANLGQLNELVPTVAMRGQQYTIGGNAGYKFGALRAEVSAEYRRHAGGTISDTTELGSYMMTSKTEQYAGLMSLYYDMEIPDTQITPYLGLGAGLAYTKTNYAVTHTDGGVTTNGNIRYALGTSPASAAMAGIAVQLTDKFTLDFGYKFMGIGGGNAKYAGADNAAAINAASGGVLMVNPTGFAAGESLIYPDFASHEVKLGMRYSF